MGGNKTALAAMELLKRATLKGEEVAVYLDVMEFLQGIAKEEFLVFSVTDMQTLKADNKELRRQITDLQERINRLTEVVKVDNTGDYVAPLTPEEAGLEDIEWVPIPSAKCPKCGQKIIHHCSAMKWYKCYADDCDWQGDWSKIEDA